MKTGERIKMLRKEKHISAESIAVAAKVSPATIYRYENGDIAEVPLEKAEAIATALNTTVAYLTGKLETDLRALDIEIRYHGHAGVELVDLDIPGVSARYSSDRWQRLQERDDFKTVWSDLQREKEKLAPELRDELSEVSALFHSLTDGQKEQALNFLRFLKGNEGTR
jgi:transcriptional regulator with XRE-family HTH domain